MPGDTVDLEIEDGIATVTLNRPDARNALSEDVSAGIVGALDEIEGGDARVVVLGGAGDAFCAGGDVGAMVEGLEDEVPTHRRVEWVEDTSRALRAVYEFDLPVVAKVDGAAFGAGANLAIACDVQVASPAARLSFGFRQVGLAVDTGTSYFLPRAVGENTAKELVLTGEMVDAEEAHRLGLVTTLFEEDFEAQFRDYVDRLATGPTVALKTSKRLLRQGLQSDLDQAIGNEAAAQAQVFESRDHEEGATAFLEGRDPEFEGR